MLIPNWRQGWRLWSVRVPAIGTLLLVAMLAAPDLVLSLWHALPPELLAMLPANALLIVPIALNVAAIAARMVRQRRLDDGR